MSTSSSSPSQGNSQQLQLPAVTELKGNDCLTPLLDILEYASDSGEVSSSSSSAKGEGPKAQDQRGSIIQKASKLLIENWNDDWPLVDALWLAFSVASATNKPSPKTADENKSTATVRRNDSATLHLQQLTKQLIQGIESTSSRATFVKKLQDTMDPLFLEAVGVSKEGLLKRMRKVNTDTFYKQHKFNLFQEETEGYAKLLTILLGNQRADAGENDVFGEKEEDILNVMGTFDLDPNRVLDLLLDLTLHHDPKIMKDDYTKLVKRITQFIRHSQFPLEKIPILLAFKLKNARPLPTGAISHQEESLSTLSPSVFRGFCLLANEGLVDLAALTQSDRQEIHSLYQRFDRLFKQRIKSMGRVRLSGGNAGSSAQDAKLDQEQREIEKAASELEKTNNNVFIGLLKELISQQDWDAALKLASTPSEWMELCSLMPETFGRVLIRSVQSMAQIQYDKQCRVPYLLLDPTEVPKTTMIKTKNSEDGLGDGEDTSLNNFFLSCSVPLRALTESGCIREMPILCTQLCRLIKSSMQKQRRPGRAEPAGTGREINPQILSLLQNCLIPALSILPTNPALSSEIWSCLEAFPYPIRYNLYGWWMGNGLEKASMMPSSSFPSKSNVLVVSEMEAGKSARYILKRLSHETMREMGRQIAKVTHSNPLVVFSTILNQIESYDNMVEMMVDTLRYVTPLSLDVLGYCILSRLDRPGDRVKEDGVNVMQWLQSLESFVGAFYKRYPYVEFRGVLCYLIRQLQEGSTSELGLLRNLIKNAGGYSYADYVPISSLSEEQLQGRAGSQVLKRETCAFGVVDQFNVRSSRRIRSVFQQESAGIKLLLLLAQVRHRQCYEDDSSGGHKKKPKPVKLIGNIYDSCQIVMSMLLEFLTVDESLPEEKDEEPIVKYSADLPSLRNLQQGFGLDVVTSWMLYRPVYRLKAKDKKASQENDTLSKEVNEAVQLSFPVSCWASIRPLLVEAFFGYALQDIYYPDTSYSIETERLAATQDRLEKEKSQTEGSKRGMMMTAGVFDKGKKEELERVKLSLSRMKSDVAEQKAFMKATMQRLRGCASKFFPDVGTVDSVSASGVQTFLMRCVFPRCMLGPDDATYCARFVKVLFDLETPGFSIMEFMNELTETVAGVLFSSTESEAASFAIMLLELWTVMSSWRYKRDAFDADIAAKKGPVSFSHFKDMYNKWHALIGSAAIGALHSSEYMHQRASFLLLTRMVRAYPTKPGVGEKILKALEPLEDDANPLQDIKASAQAYRISLVKARADGVWQEEDKEVAKAREEKEKAAVAERKRKAKERFAQMERDSKKITQTLRSQPGGDERDWNSGRSGDRRNQQGNPPASNPVVPGGSAPLSRHPSSGNLGVTFEPARGSRGTDQSSRRRGGGGGGEAGGSGRLDGRWERGPGHSTTSGAGKRARSPDRDRDHDWAKGNKRTKTDEGSKSMQGSSGDGHQSRRPDSRGGGTYIQGR